MLGWALAFFVAAVIAAMFGFGVVASTFAGIAMILFWVFVGLLVVSLILSLFGGGRIGVAHVGSDGHVHRSPGFGGLGFVAIVAVIAIAAYAWVQNDWSAEQAGRALDQGAAEITADAGEAIERAGDRAGNLIERTGDEMRTDAAQGLDRAQETIDPDQSEETASN